jgi:DNA repair exonuclease SbcCD ATPase subunit
MIKGAIMITLEQLDELESRIIRALELIGDLRTENSRLEVENQKLREEHDQLKNALEQKERDIQVLKSKLEETNKELQELKEKESILEKRISDILSKLADAEGSNYQSGMVSTPISPKPQKEEPIISNDELTIVEEDTSYQEVKEDESAVEIELEKPIEKPTLKQEETTEEHGFVKQASLQEELDKPEVIEEEEIIVLDEDEDEIILAEDSDEEVFIEEDKVEDKDLKKDLDEVKTLEENKLQEKAIQKKEENLSLDDDIILDDEDIGVFELDDDEDFLIIEENEDNNKTK